MGKKKTDGKKFSVTVDAKGMEMLAALVEKIGVKQNGVINMAIRQMYAREIK